MAKIVFSIIIVLLIATSIILFILIKKSKKDKMIESINNLTVSKNIINSKPITFELKKVEELATSPELMEKVRLFKERYDDIRNNRINDIDTRIKKLEITLNDGNSNDFFNEYRDLTMDLSDCETEIDSILAEIQDITGYEDRNRKIITKLKSRYRTIEYTFEEKKTLYADFSDTISLQLENIEKRFNDFDTIIEGKLYNEVPLVVNSIEMMIEHLETVMKELPDILLLSREVVPNRIKELREEYQSLVDLGYPLQYFDFDKNMDEINNIINEILDRCQILNIDGSLIDLKNILVYLDSILKDFDKEKNAKREFEDNNEIFSRKVSKLEKSIKSLYDQMDDIKALYDLREKDLEKIEKVNLKFSTLIKDYKMLLKIVKSENTSYIKSNISLYELMQRISYIEDDFNKSIKSLGRIHDDQERAIDQLQKTKELVKKAKLEVRKYHLPVINDSYYIELEDAVDAINVLETEINTKPVEIKTLNVRTETAIDLAYKFYSNTNEMIKLAYVTELLVVYGNRYRDDPDVSRGLSKVEMLYYKGDYNEAYTLALRVLELKEKGITRKVVDLCSK